MAKTDSSDILDARVLFVLSSCFEIFISETYDITLLNDLLSILENRIKVLEQRA